MSTPPNEHFPSVQALNQRLVCACPKCAQRLVLMEDQLDAAEGWVRCFRCEQVFLALACLLDAKSVQRDENAQPKEVEQNKASPLSAAPGPLAASSVASPHGLQPISIDEFLHRQALVNSTHPQPEALGPPIEPSSDTMGMMGQVPAHEEVRVRPQRRNSRFGLYLNGGLLFIFVLLPVSFMLRFRNEVAAFSPALKAPLVQVCHWLQCEVEWPRDLSALSIESSSLEKEELSEAEPAQNVPLKSKRVQFQLSLRIKNSFSYPLAAPQIKLTLLDERDQVLLEQKLLIPLAQDAPVIKPGALNQFLLPIDWDPSQGRLPSGYRVELE